MRKHPIQNIHKDQHGTHRFVENKIVGFLLDQYKPNLNDIAGRMYEGEFSKEDYEQLMMLIGYSLGGFEELCMSFGDEEKACKYRTLAAAQRKKMWKEKK